MERRIRQTSGVVRSRPWVAVLIAFAAGLLLGWMVLGWWLFPVRWTDAGPADLEKSYHLDYLAMVADSYLRNPNGDLALARLKDFSQEDIDQAVQSLAQQDRHEQSSMLRSLSQMKALAAQPRATARPTARAAATAATTAAAPAAPRSLGDRLRLACGGLLLIVLLLLGLLLGARFLKRVSGRQPAAATRPAAQTPSASSFPLRKPVDTGKVTRVVYEAGQPGFSREFMVYGAQGERLGSWQLQVPRDPEGSDLAASADLELFLTDRREGITTRTLLFASQALPDDFAGTGPRLSRDAVAIQKDSIVEATAGGLILEAKVTDLVYDRPGPLPGSGRLERLILDVVVDEAPETDADGSNPDQANVYRTG